MLGELTSLVDSLSLSVCIFRRTTPWYNAIKHFINVHVCISDDKTLWSKCFYICFYLYIKNYTLDFKHNLTHIICRHKINDFADDFYSVVKLRWDFGKSACIYPPRADNPFWSLKKNMLTCRSLIYKKKNKQCYNQLTCLINTLHLISIKNFRNLKNGCDVIR